MDSQQQFQQPTNEQVKLHWGKVKLIGVKTCKTGIGLSKTVCSRILLPAISKSSRWIKQEAATIHRNQNWFKRCGMTLSGNAVGLLMAISSTKIVDHFVEVREMGNLWGLLASRPVVSETTYEVLNFTAEFIVALIVFTITEHYYQQFRKRSEETA